MPVRIADIPPDARPRERLERLGLAALSEVELIALVIRSGKVGESALETAARLLADRGGMKPLSYARLEEISQIGGVGVAKAASLLAAFELGRRAEISESDSEVVRNPEQLAKIASRHLSDPTREELLVIVLGAGHKFIRVVPVAKGGTECCLIPTREILAAVLRNDGVAFAIVHNHPSEDLRPSGEDVRSTLALAEASERTGIRFLDHLIVSRSRWLSLREAGYFEQKDSGS